jgi:hypothetical protein
MANSRYYSSIAQQTTLTSGITSSGTTMIVAATTGFPGSLPYTLAVDYGASNEELVEVTGVAGTTLTVTRAIDSTSGSSHNPGAVVRHVSSARDFTDSRTHEAASTNVHGLSGGAAVVGTTQTQTLTNKTVTHVLGSADNFKLYNKGATGVTQVIGDSTNSSVNRIEILDDETSLNVMAYINSGGAIKSISRSGDGTNTYRLRLTDNDGTTDRFAVLAGGTIAVSPNSSTTFVGVDLVAPDTSTSKRAIRVAASGGGTERFTVWNDGRVDIVGTAAAFSQFDVTAAASQSADIMRVLDSSSNTQFGIQSSGKMLANKGATIAQPGVTSGAVLQVGGSNTGYTGNLTQWVSPANVIVANINESGQLTTADHTVNGTLTVNGTVNATDYTQTTSTGASVVTAATGWSVSTARAMKKSGWVIVELIIARTGATLTAASDGNLTDTDLCTLDSSVLPDTFFSTDRMVWAYSTGTTAGTIGLNPSTGLIQVLDAHPTSTITNTSTLRAVLVYPL